MIHSGIAQAAPLPANETARLEFLEKYRLWHTPPDAGLDRLTRIAADHFQAPTALISLVGKDQQWFKSRVGLDACETSRDVSFCSHAILRPEVLVIPDALLDPRFQHNSLVTGPPWIRFYAGAPLQVEADIRIGSFCIIDYEPRPQGLSGCEAAFLKELAALAVGMFDQYMNRNLFEASPAAIYVFDAETQAILSCNTAAVNLLGYPTNEFESLTLHQLFEPESSIIGPGDNLPFTFSSGQSGPWTHVTKDGSKVLALITARQISYLGRNAVMSILTDITEMTDTQRRLQLALTTAESAAKAKAQFLSNMSHELRTPLTHIIGMADLLLCSDVSEEQKEYAEVICSAGQTLEDLVSGILEYSRENSSAIQTSAFSPQTLLSEALVKWSGKCARNSVDLQLKVGPHVPLLVSGANTKISQVLDRLLSNATKFTSAGRVEVELTAAKDENGITQLHFAVTDSGVGISQEMAGQIFKPFHQEDTSHTRSFGGAGLGLAICKKIVDELKGRLSFTSSKGTGSTFRFSVPVALCSASDHQSSVQDSASLV